MITLSRYNRLEMLWNEAKLNNIIPEELSVEAESQMLKNKLEVSANYSDNRTEVLDLQHRLTMHRQTISLAETLLKDVPLQLDGDLKLIVTDTNGVILASQAKEYVGYCCPAAGMINSNTQLSNRVNTGITLEINYDNGIHSQLIPIFNEQGNILFWWGVCGSQPIPSEASNLLYLVVQLFLQKYDHTIMIDRYTGSIMNAISECAVLLDENYSIINANDRCLDLFRISNKNILKGLSINALLSNNRSLDELEDILTAINIEPFMIHAQDEDIPCQVLHKEYIDTAYGMHIILVFTRLNEDHNKDTFGEIIGDSQEFKKVKLMAQRAAKFSTTVLIEGESGTGKELLAEAIYRESQRPGKFVAINCGAIPSELIQSELFGYDEGAFTGAKKKGKPGKFEIANGGTVFLDEIGEMPVDMQVSLLRFLQDKTITRMGSNVSKKVDVRIIAATNRKLKEEVNKGTFREDLYYRLNVIHIDIPPLRKRIEDIPLLANYFIDKLSKRHGIAAPHINQQAMKALMNCRWQGNIRELENEIERALIFSQEGELVFDNLTEAEFSTNAGVESIEEDIAQIEKEGIEKYLRIYQGNISHAAKAMGITRQTLYNKIKALHIKREAYS